MLSLVLYYTGRDTRFQSTLISEEKSKTAAAVSSHEELLFGKVHTVDG
jgi:hypothetical protein